MDRSFCVADPKVVWQNLYAKLYEQQLKNYIEQQNAAKLETAQCLIIICGVASFSIYFDMLEQLSTSSVSFPLSPASYTSDPFLTECSRSFHG